MGGFAVGFHQVRVDVFQRRFNPQQHIIIPVAQDAIAQRSQFARSRGGVAIPLGMLAAVQLDDQLGLWTQEVGNEAGDRHLTTKAKAFQLLSA